MTIKIRRRIIIIIIGMLFLSLYFIFVKGFYAASDKWTNTYSGPNTKQIEYFMSYDPWIIAENKYKENIFIYKDNALQLAKLKFSNILDKAYDLYHKEYKLSKLNNHNIKTYRDLIANMPCDDEEKKELTLMFLDIYRNGLKRWIYIPGVGIDRIYVQ